MPAGEWNYYPYQLTTTGATQSTTSTILNATASNTWSYTTPEAKGEPIYDEFAVMVWEQRKAAGIEEPHPEPVGWKEPEQWWNYPPGQQINIGSSQMYTFGFTGWASSSTTTLTDNISTGNSISAQLTGQRSDNDK